MWPFSSRKRRPKTSDHPRRTCQPSLEVLEDRCVPTAGQFDPTFGSGGVVTTALSKNDFDYAYRTAVQPDGKIITVGQVGFSASRYGLTRYNPNGSLDTSFGSGGKVVVGSSNESHYAFDIALQPNGKIDITDANSWTVLQFNPNGSLDTSFGKKGVASISFTGYPTGYATYCRLVIQPPAPGSTEGKIVVAGDVGTYTDGVFGLARLNPSGSLDTSFGIGGEVTTTIGTGAGYYASPSGGVVLQGDGKIVVVGHAGPSNPTASNPWAFLVARYNTNGSLDAGFGSGGITTTVVAPVAFQAAQALLVQPEDGKIVAAGNANNVQPGITAWELVRYNPDGSLDTGFGYGGIETLATGGTIRGAAIGSDGNIVVAGNAGGSFAVGFLVQPTIIGGVTHAVGSPDPTFGTGGVATTPVGAGSNYGSGLAVQPDGRIVVAGYGQVGTRNQFVVLRYLSSAPQIGSFTASPDSVTTGGSVTLTAANITDGNPTSSVTQVAFYIDSNGDNLLQPGNDVLLGYGSINADGTWTFTFTTAGWAAGNYTLFARAKDSFGVFGEPFILPLQLL